MPRFTGSLDLPCLNSLPHKQAFCENQCKLYPDLLPFDLPGLIPFLKRPSKSGSYCTNWNHIAAGVGSFRVNRSQRIFGDLRYYDIVRKSSEIAIHRENLKKKLQMITVGNAKCHGFSRKKAKYPDTEIHLDIYLPRK